MENKSHETLNNNLLLIIIGLMIFLCVFTFKIHKELTTNYGSIEHYDSLYEERKNNISMNQNGEIIGYTSPEGIKYELKIPINANDFYNN